MTVLTPTVGVTNIALHCVYSQRAVLHMKATCAMCRIDLQRKEIQTEKKSEIHHECEISLFSRLLVFYSVLTLF